MGNQGDASKLPSMLLSRRQVNLGKSRGRCSRQRSGVVKAWQLGSWAWTWGKGDRAEVKRVESRPTAQSADPRGGEVRAWGRRCRLGRQCGVSSTQISAAVERADGGTWEQIDQWERP